MPARLDPRYDRAPQFGGGGSYRAGDSVADIIMRSGQARAEAAYRGAGTWDSAIDDISHNIVGALTQSAQMGDQEKVADAVALAGAGRYPSATHAVPGTAAAEAEAQPDPGMNHLDSILGSLSPEQRIQAEKGIKDAQSTATAYRKSSVELKEAQQRLTDLQRKAQQDVSDHWGLGAVNLSKHLGDVDGGIGAANFFTSFSGQAQMPGTERLAPMAEQAAQALEEAKSSGDPARVQAVVEAWRKQVAPIYQQGIEALSPEKRKALADAANAENPAGVAMPDNGLVNPRTGGVIAPGPGRRKQLQDVALQIDGKAVMGSFDPELGKFFYEGKEVANPQRAVTPREPGGMGALYSDVDPKAIAAAIVRGEQPPVITDLGRPVGAAVSSELAKSGYNLARAQTDWKATQKHIATMNGAQQLRLNQAINSLPDLLDSVDTLATQWKGGKFPILNKANLALAKGGAYGSDVASVANKLDAQVADVVADLAVVYMGGNSPTDHGLQLAGKSLSGDWDEKVLRDMVKMAKGNVTIRRNSILNTGVAGASEGNQYAPPPPAAAPPPPPAGGGAPEPTATGPNGQKLVLRNGQWVPVQ